MVGEKYIEAVAAGANALPVLVPALGPGLDLAALLEACDGLLLTGSASNVEPHHYGGPASAPGTLHDPSRDATTLPLIPQAIAAGLPVLAICRGFQEMNVAYGGTLHQRLHEVGILRPPRGRIDAARRAIRTRARGPAGAWRTAARNRRTGSPEVNSLHWQGVETLGKSTSPSRRARRTESSRRSGWPMRRASRSACNGTRNGSFSGTRFPARCSPPSERPAGGAPQAQGDLWQARFSNS